MNEQARECLVRGAAESGVLLDAARLEKFYRFAAELKKWAKKINLTAITSDEDIAVKHFVDSVTLFRIVTRQGRLIDIGSGGGFPAIPLKIVADDLDITSVDAVEKKIIFQRQVIRLLGLQSFSALHARGEELAGRYSGCFDWVVSRAFSDIPAFARIALPLIKENGSIIAMKGRGGRDEADGSAAALAKLGARVVEVWEFSLPVSGDDRALIVIKRN